MSLNSFFKSIFREKTKEELQGELQSLLAAQARDNEMIERWTKEFKEDRVEDNDNYVDESIVTDDINLDPSYRNLMGNIYHEEYEKEHS